MKAEQKISGKTILEITRRPSVRGHGRLKALSLRHDKLVVEMESRDYKHKSPLDKKLAAGSSVQHEFIAPPGRQLKLLAAKKCECRVPTFKK